jgi:hypothetical protein
MLRRDFLAQFALASSFALETVHAAQAPAREPALSLDDVVRLTHSGFPDEIIITKIKKNGKPFDLNGDELADLKKAGVSDEVVKYLLDPSLPYTPPSPPNAAAKAAEPGKKYPPDAYASHIPPEPGLYFFRSSTASATKIDLKLLLAQQSKKIIKKGKPIGYFVTSSAKTRIHNPLQTFYVRLPEGKEIEELVLVNLLDKDDRRQLDLKADDIRPRESVEVGSHLFRLTPQKLTPGEYLFFFIGSAEPPKGIYGKGYDFGIDASPATSKASR